MESKTPALDIKQYLKYYIGHEVEYGSPLEGSERKPVLRKLSSMTEEEAKDLCRMQIRGMRECDKVIIVQMLPVVKFQIYTDGEDLEYVKKTAIVRYLNIESYSVNQFHYLISKGFWIFDQSYFDLGIIIEKKMITKDEQIVHDPQ